MCDDKGETLYLPRVLEFNPSHITFQIHIENHKNNILILHFE